MSAKTKAGTIRELTIEYDIIMMRAAQIKSAILMLQAIETDEPKRALRTKLWRADDIKGVVLGNIPVTPTRKSKGGAIEKSKRIGKRPYTKKAEFWKKPHPRKRK